MPNIFRNAVRQPGEYTTGAFDVPVDVTGVRIHIDRTNLKNVKKDGATAAEQVIAFFHLERRLGNGEWEGSGGVGFGGGEVEEDWGDGVKRVSTETTMRVFFHPRFAGKADLQLRARYSLAVGMKAAVEAEWLYDERPARPPVHHSIAVEDYDDNEITWRQHLCCLCV
jgi:hypothetical protein